MDAPQHETLTKVVGGMNDGVTDALKTIASLEDLSERAELLEMVAHVSGNLATLHAYLEGLTLDTDTGDTLDLVEAAPIVDMPEVPSEGQLVEVPEALGDDFGQYREQALLLLGDAKLTQNEQRMFMHLLNNYGKELAPRELRADIVAASEGSAKQMVTHFLQKVRSTQLGPYVHVSGKTISRRYRLDFGEVDELSAVDNTEPAIAVETQPTTEPSLEEDFTALHAQWGLDFSKAADGTRLVVIDEKPVYGFKPLAAEILHHLAQHSFDTQFALTQIKEWLKDSQYEQASDDVLVASLHEIYNRLKLFNKQDHVMFVGRMVDGLGATSIGLRAITPTNRRKRPDFLNLPAR